MVKKYILKNISTSDVNLQDLGGYKIPAGKSVNILGPKSFVTDEMIAKSLKSGQLSKVMGKYLILVEDIVVALPPPKKATRITNVVTFPQRTKTYITIEVGELTEEELQAVATDEEAAFLQQLEDSTFSPDDTQVPIAARGEDGEVKKD